MSARTAARRLLEAGTSLNRTSQHLGVSYSAIRAWREAGWQSAPAARAACFRCGPVPGPPPDARAYAHLLGLYLGDGCISAHARGVYALRIACCDDYPALMDECEESMRAVHASAVFRCPKQGCTSVETTWKHWPCAFPQHGPGRKHEREIRLEPWQQVIVDEHPGALLRGLFHSDGCRVANWATTASGVRYEGYPRYFFNNASADIRGLCCDALDRLGIAWTQPGERQVSVARRGSVALLDQHVGPKR
jgi:hypothetical protein